MAKHSEEGWAILCPGSPVGHDFVSVGESTIFITNTKADAKRTFEAHYGPLGSDDRPVRVRIEVID